LVGLDDLDVGAAEYVARADLRASYRADSVAIIADAGLGYAARDAGSWLGRAGASAAIPVVDALDGILGLDATFVEAAPTGLAGALGVASMVAEDMRLTLTARATILRGADGAALGATVGWIWAR
jgi:hypothetical protein